MAIPHFSLLTICGIDELPEHGPRRVTHVLSIVDPGLPDLEAFGSYDPHHRTIMHFHDIIDPQPGQIMPQQKDVEKILDLGSDFAGSELAVAEAHLLVHCHMGISRSTAAMLSLMAQADPDAPEDLLFERLRAIRPRAWPNSVMIGYADHLLGRNGRLTAALGRHYGHQKRHQEYISNWMVELGRIREVAMAA